jgi:hypothetical protein
LTLLIEGAPYLAKAVFEIKALGCNLEYGGIEVQQTVTKGAGPRFERLQKTLTVATTLVLGEDAHALDLGSSLTGALQGSHRDDLAVAFPYQKFAAAVEIVLLNGIDIVIPEPRPR